MNLDLTPEQARVLGALVEKDLSTPEYYPLTLSALVNACNQKTNRDPVVNYTESEVAAALEGLQRKRLAGTASSAHGRVLRYRHALVEALALSRPHLAILASLLLRGPETPGELRGRTSRMHEFASLEEVDAVLAELAQSDPPLVAELARRPGQKETRYAQLLTPLAEPADPSTGSADPRPAVDGEVAERLDAIESRLEELQQAFDAFRKQFE